ncbi:hypothetical protein AAC387_Pa05g2683 [Persea americana]
MPSRLQKVIATIKDQTSISLAKVSATKLEVAILMATTHKELPVGDALVEKVVLLTFAKRAHASTCIHSLKGRMAHTSNWVVALKSLNLVFRILQEGDPYFDQQVLRAAKCGTRLLDLSNFCDKSHSSPWDYTAFIRTFALYLDERLHCTLMGKLHRATRPGHRHRDYPDHVLQNAIKPTVLLDKITYWQRLMDRALATQPTGSAKSNRLVQLSLWSVVLESFDLYRDISNGIALLLDNFFHLQLQSCFEVLDVCNKAVEQFDELAAFYSLCKSLGVGRKVEYPCVQKISERLLKTLRELLEDDEASFEIDKPMRSGSQFLALPAPPFKRSVSSDEDFNSELNSEEELELPSLLAEQSVLESALIALKEKAAKVHRSIYLDNKFSPDLLLLDSGNQQQQQRQLPSSQFSLFHQDANSILDLVPWGDPSQHQETPSPSCSEEGRNESWERILTECVEKRSNQANCDKSSANNSLLLQSLYNHTSAYGQHQNYSNPFLQADYDANVCLPTFCANPEQNPTLPLEINPFSSAYKNPV